MGYHSYHTHNVTQVKLSQIIYKTTIAKFDICVECNTLMYIYHEYQVHMSYHPCYVKHSKTELNILRNKVHSLVVHSNS